MKLMTFSAILKFNWKELLDYHWLIPRHCLWSIQTTVAQTAMTGNSRVMNNHNRSSLPIKSQHWSRIIKPDFLNNSCVASQVSTGTLGTKHWISNAREAQLTICIITSPEVLDWKEETHQREKDLGQPLGFQMRSSGPKELIGFVQTVLKFQPKFCKSKIFITPRLGFFFFNLLIAYNCQS